MQRMDSLDSANNKIVFKKRSHRPWSPTIQENAKILFECNNELNNFDSDRLMIGGFSFPNAPRMPSEPALSQKSTAIMDELKSKEQEIQTLSTNLKIATALEQAEKIELSRKKEVLARTVAEEKALNAIQQLNLAEIALQKTKQQLQKEESIKKSLETEIKNVLHAIEDNENTIAREIESKRIAEEKLSKTLSCLSEKEHHIRLEAEKTIRDNLRDSIGREKNIQQTLADRINGLQNEHKEQILKIQCAADLRIAEAEEKIYFHEKAKIEAQQWLQNSQEATRQIEIQKTEVENNLATTIQNANDQKSQHEAVINDLSLQISQLTEQIALMDSANVALKQQLSENLSELNVVRQTEINTTIHVESLNLQIQQLTENLVALKNEKAELTTLFTDILGKSKILQSIVSNERQLRIILAKKISEMESEKAKNQEKHDNALEQVYKIEISELVSKQLHLEAEKALIEEKHNKTLLHANQLEIMLESEKSLRKDAKKLKMIEESARKAAQEKISSAIEQANKTILTVLGNCATTEVSND